MRFNKLISLFNRSKTCLKILVTPLHTLNFSYQHRIHKVPRSLISSSASLNVRIPEDEAESDDELDPEKKHVNLLMNEGYARDLLNDSSKDLLHNLIYCCASVEELFTVLDKNIDSFKCNHTTQSILVLHDLQKIYKEFMIGSMKSSSKATKTFFQNLESHSSFQTLLNLAEKQVNSFDSEHLSYCVLYLNKLGLVVENKTMQILCNALKNKLLNEFSLAEASRFIETAFSEVNLRSYFMTQELLPLVYKEIETCASPQDLHYLSISLNKLHHIVSKDILLSYIRKVESLLNSNVVGPNDTKVLLQIILLLNYPKWRENNTVVTSKCIMLLQNTMHKLNANEVVVLYEMFYRLEEPGSILNNLQRCTYKHFHQLDDIPTEEKIHLLCTIIFFSSPLMRLDFQKKIKLYVEQCQDLENLLLLRRLVSYTKISDAKLCDLFWNKVCNFLKTEQMDLLHLCQHYINFNTDVDNYRHAKFEAMMLDSLRKLINDTSIGLIPQRVANILDFVFLYSDDDNFIRALLKKLESNWRQLKPIDCLKLAYTLKIFERNKSYKKKVYARQIDAVISAFVSFQAGNLQESWKISSLLKTCIYRNKFDCTIPKLLEHYKRPQNITSKSIENIYYCSVMSNFLIPEVLDNISSYVINYEKHVLGFNAGRVVFMCYDLGYRPKDLNKFCDTVVDIIIRDQERMTGLSLITSALALCFFNKLPNFLIRAIFNVEFMDKLDEELQQCYGKDRYPNRVRNYLLQLNRAVCLDYPETNVPWFHQKFVDENRGKKQRPTLFSARVKEYLVTLTSQHKNAIIENAVTPYGYHIDFVLNLDSENGLTNTESQVAKRLALLLIPENAYTKMATQLRGSYQLKKRHLEILGYKVVCVRFSDWFSLFYGEDRIEFLRGLIWPNQNRSNIDICR